MTTPCGLCHKDLADEEREICRTCRIDFPHCHQCNSCKRHYAVRDEHFAKNRSVCKYCMRRRRRTTKTNSESEEEGNRKRPITRTSTPYLTDDDEQPKRRKILTDHDERPKRKKIEATSSADLPCNYVVLSYRGKVLVKIPI